MEEGKKQLVSNAPLRERVEALVSGGVLLDDDAPPSVASDLTHFDLVDPVCFAAPRVEAAVAVNPQSCVRSNA